MIWVAGNIVEDDALTVSVCDRTFEHGLGLFETLRTWNKRAALLDAHLARMTRSAEQLGVPLDPGTLPTADAIDELRRANGFPDDAAVRITLTGGLSEERGSVVWMHTRSLPEPRRDGAVVDLGSWVVTAEDPLARHKTLNYWARRIQYEKARLLGFDEVLSITPDGSVWEGSRTNLFLVRDQTLVTPATSGPLVSGIMRSVVLDVAKELPLTTVEVENLTEQDLLEADEVFLSNSVRGLIPVARIKETSWSVPGSWTQALTILVHDRLSQTEEAGS